MVLVGAVVHFSFRPVIDLAKRLDAEQADHPHPIPSDERAHGAPAVHRVHQPAIESNGCDAGSPASFRCAFGPRIANAYYRHKYPEAENVDMGGLPQDARNRLQALKEGIRRTVRLLEQLLTLSKYDYGKALQPETVMLDGIVKSVIADFMVSASARAIDLGCNRLEAGAVAGDSTALTIMVRNLVDNAVRYSPKGGQINLSVHRDRDSVILSVEDIGPGIGPDDLNVVFEPFSRGRLAKGDGTGLGLSIVRRILDSHGGAISLQNRDLPGRSGLQVTVRLPAAPVPLGPQQQRV